MGDDPPGCEGYTEEYAILSSGDLTSQGYFSSNGQPLTDFPKNLGDVAGDLPLVSTVHMFPDGETPWGDGWIAYKSQWPTKAEFFRTMPSSNGFILYAGRFVWEQTGGGEGNDGCHTDIEGSPPPFTSVTGGGWYVHDGTGVWGPDVIGIPSQWIDWYQAHYGPAGECTIVIPQAMNINTSDESSTQYTTNQLIIEIWPNEVCTEVQTMDSQTVKQGLTYPPAPGTDEGPQCLNDQ